MAYSRVMAHLINGKWLCAFCDKLVHPNMCPEEEATFLGTTITDAKVRVVLPASTEA